MPVVDPVDKQVTYEFTPGPFTNILRAAYLNPCQKYVLIIEGAPEPEKTSLTLEEAAAQVKAMRESGISVSDAAKQVAKQTGYKKGELYRLALEDENSTL